MKALRAIAARDQALAAAAETSKVNTRPAAYAAACQAAAKTLGCQADDDEARQAALWAMNKTLGR